MGNQLLAIFYIVQRPIYVYGCWDEETPEHEFDFYDLYDEEGRCLNEGSPFFESPTWQDVKDFLDQ